MFGRNFETILAECLDAMHHGATVDDCLARYPKQARRLAPQLSMAERVSRTPMAVARPEAEALAWRALQKRAHELRTGTARPKTVRAAGNGLPWLKPVAATALVFGLFFTVSSGLLYAAQDAPPDSSLYAVKLAGEDLRVMLIFDDTRKAEVLLDQSSQRMSEINETVREGKPVPENALSAMNSRNQKAADIVVDLPPEAEHTVLRERLLSQAEEQEQRLLAIWPQVQTDDRDTYTETVANLHNTQLGGGVSVADVSLRPEALSGGILTISGLAELGDDGIWRIGGFEVRIDERTFGKDNVRAGSGASILAAKSSNGQLQALTADLQDLVVPTAVVSGAVEQITEDGITVAGKFIPFSKITVPLDQLRVGEKVQVQVHGANGEFFAGSISQFAAAQTDDETFWFEGTLEGDVSRSTSQWSVGGLLFETTANPSFDTRAGPAVNGARVQIEATSKDGTLQARRVTVLASQATADSVNVLGTFGGYDGEEEVWKISGLAVAPPATATPDDDPPTGSLVLVETVRQGSDLVAMNIEIIERPNDESGLVQLEGTIKAIDGSRWTLEIGQVRVASTAKVRGGEPDIGKRVIVWVTQSDEGLNATFARILDQSPVITPAPVTTPAPATPTP